MKEIEIIAQSYAHLFRSEFLCVEWGFLPRKCVQDGGLNELDLVHIFFGRETLIEHKETLTQVGCSCWPSEKKA